MTATMEIPAGLGWQPEELAALEPRRKLSVLEWAEQYRRLDPKTSAMPGPWRWGFAPFLIEPAAAWSDHVVHQITVRGCTQFGKTELANNIIGRTVMEDPCPSMVVMPTENDARIRVRTRVRPMFEHCPELLARLGGDIETLNIGEPTDFGNMFLYLAWAASSATTADRPLCLAILDEVGEYAMMSGETDAVSRTRNRQRTFPFRRMLVTSSPKNEGDLICREYDAGDRREYWVPCPGCRQYHPIAWSCVEWDKGADGHSLDPEVYQDPLRSRYRCPRCREAWGGERARFAAVRRGVWVPAGCEVVTSEAAGKQRPTRPALGAMALLRHVRDGGKWDVIPRKKADAWIVGEVEAVEHLSYHVWAGMLNARLATIAGLVREWVVSGHYARSGDLQPRQNFINSQLGEPWEVIEVKTDADTLAEHVESYPPGVIPAGGARVVMGIDIQLDHIYVSTWVFGYQYEAWLVWAERLETGDTSKLDNWDAVMELLTRPWPLLADPEERIERGFALLDCQYNTDAVYQFCRGCGLGNVLPARGDDNVPRADFQRTRRVDRQMPGRARRYTGLRRIEFSPTAYKDRLARMAGATEPGGGYVHLYAGTPRGFLTQFCSEEKKLPRGRGKKRPVWLLKRGHYDNHYWDCGVLALVGADLAGVGRIPNPDKPAAAGRPAGGRRVSFVKRLRPE